MEALRAGEEPTSLNEALRRDEAGAMGRVAERPLVRRVRGGEASLLPGDGVLVQQDAAPAAVGGEKSMEGLPAALVGVVEALAGVGPAFMKEVVVLMAGDEALLLGEQRGCRRPKCGVLS